jgi:hypothetical protein
MWENGKILSALAEQKKCLQSGEDKEAHFKFGITNLFSFNLQRTGTKQFTYLLTTGDITLKLHSRLWSSNIPNCSLEIGSMSCQQGLDELLSAFSRWLEFHGGIILGEKVSRIDLAADIRENIENTQIDKEEFHISRTSKCARYTSDRKMTGVGIGKGAIHLRVYDKIQEMKDKKATEKQAFFLHLWGGEQEFMTRVEFQIRREAIKSMFPKKSDLKTVRLFIHKIWSYLTNDWFRQSAGEVDRVNRHQDRCEVSSFWKIVQAATNVVCSAINRNRKQLHIDIPSLQKMVRGCMVTIAAGLGHASEDFWGIMTTCRDMLTNEIAEYIITPEFKEKYALKLTASRVTF